MKKHLKEFSLTTWCIENKTTVYIFTIIITVAGLLTYQGLPKEQFPDIVIPTVYVSTIYPGTSPEDIENLITKPIEKQLKSVSGVKKVTSTSIQDFSAVIVEFNTGVDVPVAKQRVTDAVDKAKNDLPTDLDKDPQVQEVNFSEFPIMNINVAGNFPLDKLKSYAEDLQDEIEAMKEISRVEIVGALEREIQINIDLYRMQAAGLSFNDIESAVAYENVNISGGEININNVRRTLRVTGEFKSISDIQNLVISTAQGAKIFLKDIATVADGYKEKQDYARLDNRTVITLNIIKRSGENLIAASDKILESIERLKKDRFPESLLITVTGDQADSTRLQLNDLINTVILGFIFVVLVLMFFMGTTSAVFVGLAVPLSVLLAFLVMPSMDYSLNVIVLFSFLLALGIVVDDAIVVIENTHRLYHQHEDWSIEDAAKYAAGEVFTPVLAGTATNVAPFFPLLFWPGIIGEFMKYLPVTLILTLAASFLVSFIMNPVFAVSFMKRHDTTQRAPLRSLLVPSLVMAALAGVAYLIHFGLGNLMVVILFIYWINYFVFHPAIRVFQEKIWPAFMDLYRGLLRFMVVGKRPYVFFGATIVLLILSFFITAISQPKVEFFPTNEPNFIYVYNQMPIGTDARVTDSVTHIIEKRVYSIIGQKNPIVKSVISNVGVGAGDPQNPDRTVTPHKGKVTIAFVEYGLRNGVSTAEYLAKIRQSMEGIPVAQITVDQEQGGPPTGKPINIEISGEEFTMLNKISNEFRQKIQKAGIRGIEELKSDLQLNKPEILISIDREKAQREGVSTAQIALAVRTALYGKEVSKFRDAKDDYPIMVRLDDKYRQKVEDILNVRLSFRDFTGRLKDIPLNSLTRVEYAASYSSINRKNQKRVVTLSSNVLNGYNANEINGQLTALARQMDLPKGYEVKLTGQQEEQAETMSFLSAAFFAAIGLIFMILVTQFNSLSKPLIIFTTVVLSLIGVLLGFVIFKMTFSVVMTGVGIIALAGIVVKNGIILIEFTDELRARGYEFNDAIVEAGATRLTPVILTAASAILGLIPLAIGLNINFFTLFTDFKTHFYIGGDNGAFWGPLAWSIVFGLTFATFLTLVIVPSMYWMSERLKLRLGRK